jgi:uncharacterized protein YeaO (DUF488 family)
MATIQIEVRRVYDDPRGRHGEYRVLVDRLWPRGLKKDELRIDRWAKELAPSTELRRWYGHEPERFREFSRRYRKELASRDATQAAKETVDAAGRARLVVLTATKDVAHSGAHVLAQRLRRSGAGR